MVSVKSETAIKTVSVTGMGTMDYGILHKRLENPQRCPTVVDGKMRKSKLVLQMWEGFL